MAKFDVFISYSRKDTAVADQICEALDKANISYFIDRQGIVGGMEFPVILADAICDSRLFLFLASKNSYESKFTNNEITFAFNEKPKQSILPYIIDGSELPRHMRFVFAGINWRNITEHPVQTVLVSDIAKLLGRETHGSSSEYKHGLRVLTPKQISLTEDIKNRIDPLSNILNSVIWAKRRYSAIIRVKSYKLVPEIGVAVVGEIIFGQIPANGKYIIKNRNRKEIKANAVLTHDITNNRQYSDIVLRTMKRCSSRVSEYDLYAEILASNTKLNSSNLCVKTGNIAGLILSGITTRHMENCKFIYKLNCLQ